MSDAVITSPIEKPGVLKTEDESLDSGSIIHWGERGPNKRRHWTMITCGGGRQGCEGKRRALIPYGKDRKSPTAGYCRICDPRPPGQPRKYTGDVLFPNRTVAHLDSRDPMNTDRVEIDCAGCGKAKHAMLLSVLDPDWCKVCVDCFYERGGPNPRGVIKDEPVAFGSIIHWSEWYTGLRLTLTCGICVANGAPKTKHKMSRGNIPPEAVRQRPDYMRFCRRHSRAEVALHLTRFQNGDGQKDGGVPKRRGRKAGTLGFDHAAFLADVNRYIVELWQRHRSVRVITRKAVASQFNSKGEMIGDEAIKDRLRICGVIEAWPAYRESVIRMATEI
jgi:hypothetical protein